MDDNLNKHAKFLIKELLTTLELIPEDNYDSELEELLGELTLKLEKND